MSLFGFNVSVDAPSSAPSSKSGDRVPSVGDAHITQKILKKFPKTEDEATQLEHEIVAYFHTCIFNGDIEQAENVLRKFDEYKTSSMFHVFLRTHLKDGNLAQFVAILELMRTVNVKEDMEILAMSLAAYGRCLEESGANYEEIRIFLTDSIERAIKSLNVDLDRTFRKCALLQEEKRLLLIAIDSLYPNVDGQTLFCPTSPWFSSSTASSSSSSSSTLLEYDCDMVDHLNKLEETYPNPFYGAIDVDEAKSRMRETWKRDCSGLISADRIDDVAASWWCLGGEGTNAKRTPTTSPILDLHRQMWRKSISEALQCHLNVLKKKKFNENVVSVYPYLKMFTLEELTDFLVDEIDQIVLWTKPMAFPNHVLAMRIGRIFASRAVAKQHRLYGDFDTFEMIYSRYLEFYADERRKFPTERHFWESMRREFPILADMDVSVRYWPQSVRLEVGHLLLHVVVSEALFNLKLLDSDGESGEFTPLFHIGFKYINPNRDIYRLYKEGGPVRQSYPSTELPTLLPPMPWINAAVNGSILSDTAVIRFERDDKYAYETLAALEQKQLYPPLDALNHLASCPWRVNEFVLDVAAELFHSGGDPDVAIPETELMEESRSQQGGLQQKTVTDNKNWFSAMNNLSIAQSLRGQVFWLPHHMDYRGRCTTVSTFLTHHGPDLVRGIITFGNRKPLGEKGLDWLKIHAINVAGLKKRNSLAERVEYANEIMDDILDSAKNPLNGAGWWRRGDKPWETLAACKEISEALATPSPETFMSSLPIHQDGSCNSMQHMCALMRDQVAGESVNLGPSRRPNDPYADIIDLLEKKRVRDARRGYEEAIILEGFLERTVVKRVVMRVGYGAGKDSAVGYVEDWLMAMNNFPPKHIRKCSKYLGLAILECNDQKFKSSAVLRRWLLKLAEMVIMDNGSIVLWNSALGLPIHQPEYTNVITPNFIHALDAAHMMLTALHAHRSGITFAAVHDCFWSHAGSVNAMNEVCRQEFHRLHSSGLLEDLHDQFSRLKAIDDEIPQIPRRGTLDIDKVLESTYLFQ